MGSISARPLLSSVVGFTPSEHSLSDGSGSRRRLSRGSKEERWRKPKPEKYDLRRDTVSSKNLPSRETARAFFLPNYFAKYCVRERLVWRLRPCGRSDWRFPHRQWRLYILTDNINYIIAAILFTIFRSECSFRLTKGV